MGGKVGGDKVDVCDDGGEGVGFGGVEDFDGVEVCFFGYVVGDVVDGVGYVGVVVVVVCVVGVDEVC